MKRKCIACNIKLDEDNYMKKNTVCKNFFKKKGRKIKTIRSIVFCETNYKPHRFDLHHQNNRTFIVRPSFSIKTHLIMKTPSRILDQSFYKNTKSPPEQNSKTKIRKIVEKKIPINEYETAIVVVDDILGTSNSK